MTAVISVRQVSEWGSADTAPYDYPVRVFSKRWLGGCGAEGIGVRTKDGWIVRGFIYEGEESLQPQLWTWMLGPRAEMDDHSEPDVPLWRGAFPEQARPS